LLANQRYHDRVLPTKSGRLVSRHMKRSDRNEFHNFGEQSSQKPIKARN
jgi:hypothetical protein